MTARRSISQTRRARIFAASAGVCHICGGKIQSGQGWDAEHRIPLALGGADDDSNLAPAHRKCHAGKTKADVSQIAKCERQRLRHIGIRKRSANPMPGSKASGIKKHMDGRVTWR